MRKKEILVIGAGVVGTLIARELTELDCSVTVFEKLPDVGWGITKANSGIIHAGYSDNPGSVRAKYCTPGNRLYDALSEELDFNYKKVASLVIAFDEHEEKTIEDLLFQGKQNGVIDLSIISRDQILKIEPSINPQTKLALYTHSSGIVAPWEVAIAAYENAKANGARFIFNREVTRFFRNGEKVIVETKLSESEYDFVINASGIFSDEIAFNSGIKSLSIYPRKGEYILLDENKLVRNIIFPSPGIMGKGILVLPTVHDTTLLGPTAEDLPESYKENTETTFNGISNIISQTVKLVPCIDFSKTIRTFAGLRPENSIHDFEIEFGDFYINLSAIRSPGLTSAPKIAKDTVQFVKEKFKMKINKEFNPIRKRILSVNSLNKEEKKRLIRENSKFGRIVCRCNKVTEGEIIEAIRRGANTLDGIKFRTLAQFGRCQGSFCILNIMKILSKELGIPINEIVKNVDKSRIIDGETK